MSKLEEFKGFVKENPRLIKYVRNNEMSWQKFYEIYDLYGNDSSAWKEFLSDEKKEVKDINIDSSAKSDLISWIKGIDLESVREGVNSLQRVIGVMQDFGSSKDIQKEEYKPRPLYKHFED